MLLEQSEEAAHGRTEAREAVCLLEASSREALHLNTLSTLRIMPYKSYYKRLSGIPRLSHGHRRLCRLVELVTLWPDHPCSEPPRRSPNAYACSTKYIAVPSRRYRHQPPADWPQPSRHNIADLTEVHPRGAYELLFTATGNRLADCRMGLTECACSRQAPPLTY